eukprot:7015926-Alexandrium_andersonii.AAC.1
MALVLMRCSHSWVGEYCAWMLWSTAFAFATAGGMGGPGTIYWATAPGPGCCSDSSTALARPSPGPEAVVEAVDAPGLLASCVR